MTDEALYTYRAELVRVVDGDTYDLKIDVGFHSTFASRFRLSGYDTPEMRSGSDFEKEKAREATEFAREWWKRRLDVAYVRTHKSDSFGRWLAEVYDEDHRTLGRSLAALDLAVPWPMRWHEKYDQ